MILVKPPARDLNALTSYGVLHFHPEHDAIIYLGSIAAGLFLLCAAVAAGSRAGAKAESGSAFRGPAIQIAVAVVATVLAVNQYFQARAYLIGEDPVPGYQLALFALLIAAPVAAAFFSGRRSRAASLPDIHEPAPSRLRFSPLDLIVPLLVIVVIYVPSGRLLAGRFFFEELIGHWDYYVVGPALAFKHGLALGTDFSSMYGVGWPMVAAAFSGGARSFSRLIQMGSVYVCIYLSGVYLLLRLLVRRPALAALGTALAASHVFLGLGGGVIWRFPSMTVLRSSFDVWVFLALTMAWRTGRRHWAPAAGVLTGLAVAFGTDTGLSLGAACGLYWLGLVQMDRDKRARLIDLAMFGASSLGTLLAALLVASRGTLASGEFWRGWLESILEFGQGFISTPLSTGPGAGTVVVFVLVFFAYMAVFGKTVAGLITNRLSRAVLFDGFLALYGLLTMLQFLGKSDLFHYRLAIPLVIIGCHVAGRALDRRRQAPERKPAFRLAPAALLLSIGLIVLLAPKSFLVEPVGLYPSAARSLFAGDAAEGVCLSAEPKDICGLPPELKEAAAEFRQISREVAELTESGSTVAVIGETGSLPYLRSGSAPWGRYPRLFVDTITREKLQRLVDSLEQDPPDYVFMRLPTQSALMTATPGATSGLSEEDYRQFYRAVIFGVGPGANSPYPDTWEALQSVVEQLYRPEGANAAYEVFKLNPPRS